MTSIIHRSVVRSTDDPDKRNRRVHFDTDLDDIMDKRDTIQGMPDRKKPVKPRKRQDTPVFTMPRGSQEPISQRTRHQGSQKINNIMTKETIVKDIGSSKRKPVGKVKKLLSALALLSPTIGWISTWNPMKESNQLHGHDIYKCNDPA